MIQAVIKKGKVFADEIPPPIISDKSVLVKVICSCISPGTEGTTVKTTGESLLKRALKQPENIKKVFDAAKTDGIISTTKKVLNKVNEAKATGYSISGVVLEVGKNVTRFKAGDSVAAGGAEYAHHSEIVNVPENLVVKIPAGLDFRRASTVTIGSISLQGVRRTAAGIGEMVVVIGAGVLGLLAVQILRISGVRVAAIDLDSARLDLADKFGAEIVINPTVTPTLTAIQSWTNGFGADSVLFAASTSSNEPLSLSFQMCKKKGKVVMLGVSGMSISREDMYQKELDFVMSTSYGPGRYDKSYEEKCLDYPYAYVRWTENRNMHEYLRLLATNAIAIDPLLSRSFPIEKIGEAFESLNNSIEKPLLVTIDYGTDDKQVTIKSRVEIPSQHRLIHSNNTPVKIGLIGTGNFASGVHIPNILKINEKFQISAVMSRSGLKAKQVAERTNARYVTTNYDEILSDNDIDLVFITTRHDSHAELALKALKAGKHVFVEKPLAVNEQQLSEIESFFSMGGESPLLMVGFNRRFSPYAVEIKKYTDKRINPLFINYRINAGYAPLDSWVHEDGGRIVGEACHFIDLATFFIGSRIESISCEELTPNTDYYRSSDNKSFILKYQDGSIADIQYFSLGNPLFPKEQMEVHFDGKSISLNDYKVLKGYGLQINEISSKASRKGQVEELEHLYDSLRGKNTSWPIEPWDIFQTTKASLLIK